MFIISPTLSEEATKSAFDRIQTAITEQKGEINKLHDMRKRKLAYEIHGHKEGHYFLLYFTAPTQAIAKLWKEFNLHEDLLRFVTLQADEVRENLEYKPLGEV
ncbi:MAG: 30S ribosomal protein S6 [Waddliaceae bacterium]